MASRRSLPLLLALASTSGALVIQWAHQQPTLTPDPSASPTEKADGSPTSALAPEPAETWRAVQVGHDWIDGPLTPSGHLPTARFAWLDQENVQQTLTPSTLCQQPSCRTCQWMALFGGEW